MTCAQALLRLLWGGARSWSATGLVEGLHGEGSVPYWSGASLSFVCDYVIEARFVDDVSNPEW